MFIMFINLNIDIKIISISLLLNFILDNVIDCDKYNNTLRIISEDFIN